MFFFNKKSATEDEEPADLSRRSFLRNSTVMAAGVAAMAAGLAPLRKLEDFGSVEEFLQMHYSELTPGQMKVILNRIEGEVERQYGVRPHVRDYRPMNGVEFVYALNLTRCNGCRKCVHACVAENNQSRDPAIEYIRVLKMPNGTFDMEKGDHNYAAIASGAGRVVNAIPDVVAAAPGIRTTLDLPFSTAKGVFATTLNS